MTRLTASATVTVASVTAAVVVVVLALGLVAAPAARADGEQSRTILVDEGGAYDVAVHPDFVTVLYLPDRITKALASDPAGYEVKSIGATSVAIRPLRADAKPASLAIATESIKVSVVLSIAKDRGRALTQVTFKRADVEAELARRIAAAVAERTAALEAEVAAARRALDAELPARVDAAIAQRVLRRRELRELDAIERNDANVIVRVTSALYLGDDVFLGFEIQNRDDAPYRVAAVGVLDGTAVKSGLAQLTSTAAETAGRGVLGVVAPGGRARGVVVVRGAAAVVGRSLALEVRPPDRGGVITVDRIVLK